MSTTSNTFTAWYDRMKSLLSDTIAPGTQKGEQLDSCVRQVMAQGHDRESAFAICNESLKADLDKVGRDDLLETAREMTKYDEGVPVTFGNLIDYAEVDRKSEADLELGNTCVRCNSETRVKGSYLCPECDPMLDAESGDFKLVGTGVDQATEDDDAGDGEAEKSESDEATETKKVYLQNGVNGSAVPENAIVKSDEDGLYYEEEFDVREKQVAEDIDYDAWATLISDLSNALEPGAIDERVLYGRLAEVISGASVDDVASVFDGVFEEGADRATALEAIDSLRDTGE